MLTLLSRSTWTKSWDARWSLKMGCYEAKLFIKASITSPFILTNCLTIHHYVRYVRGKHGSEERSARIALGYLQWSDRTRREQQHTVCSRLYSIKSIDLSFWQVPNSCLCNFFFKFFGLSPFHCSDFMGWWFPSYLLYEVTFPGTGILRVWSPDQRVLTSPQITVNYSQSSQSFGAGM